MKLSNTGMLEFELLNECTFYKKVKCNKYRIPSNGLTITLFNHDGPVISGDIVLRTHAFDNVGLPHTLEHLVFMGSSSYPNGFLDCAANQCLSSGTNAWTSQDHTAYTVRCAGKDGFLSFLPIFLDHILFPVLTDEAYVTEVHHIDGQGKDGGVVYCEMQSYENTMECIAERAFLTKMFGNLNPYAVETGGLLNDIRMSCNIDKCRQFHKEAYQTHNMNIVICGSVDIDEVVNALSTLLVKVNDRSLENERQCTAPDINCVKDSHVTRSETVLFPSPGDSDPGCVLLGFESYSLDKPLEFLAENMLIDYLINTSASPLTKELVHIPDPYCSSLSYTRYMYPSTILQLKLNGTDSEKHNELLNLVLNIMQKVSNSGIDVNRMKYLVENKMMKEKLEVENNNLDNLTSFTFLDFIYGSKFSNLLSQFSRIEEYYQVLIDSSKEFWHTILSRLLNCLCVSIIAKPSLELLQSFEFDETQRINHRIEELGKHMLCDCENILLNAEQINSTKFSPDLFKTFSKPNLKDFDKYDRTTLRFSSNSYSNLFLHEANSSFYRIYVIIDTKRLSVLEKSILPLLIEACCNLSVHDVSSGFSMTGDEVADKCEEVFVDYNVDYGLHGEQMCMDFTLKEDNFEICIVMIQHILFNQCVDNKRVKEYLQNLKTNIKANKRCGYESVQAVRNQSLFPCSATASSSLFVQETFLETVCLDDLCRNLQYILYDLFHSDCCVHIMSNMELIQKIDIDKVANLLKLDSKEHKYNFVKLKYFLPKDIKFFEGEDIVLKVPGEETSYMVSVIPVNHSLYDPLDINMKIFNAWFGKLDGFVGRKIRGKGLAYHYFVNSSSLNGTLEFQLQQSSDISAAFVATSGVIESIISSENPHEYIEEKQVELAKNEVVYSLIESISSPHRSVFSDIENMHNGSERKSFSHILDALSKVNSQNIIDVCKMYYSKLFQKTSMKIYTIPQNTDVQTS